METIYQVKTGTVVTDRILNQLGFETFKSKIGEPTKYRGYGVVITEHPFYEKEWIVYSQLDDGIDITYSGKKTIGSFKTIEDMFHQICGVCYNVGQKHGRNDVRNRFKALMQYEP